VHGQFSDGVVHEATVAVAACVEDALVPSCNSPGITVLLHAAVLATEAAKASDIPYER
jgi:hypothetical protein